MKEKAEGREQAGEGAKDRKKERWVGEPKSLTSLRTWQMHVLSETKEEKNQPWNINTDTPGD